MHGSVCNFFRLIDNHKTSNIVISLQASIDYFTIYGNSSLIYTCI